MANKNNSMGDLKTKTAHCPNCDFKEEYEPCEFGLTFFQAEGTCPYCESDLLDEDNKPTRETITFSLTDNQNK